MVQYDRQDSYGRSLSRPDRHATASVGVGAGMVQGAPPLSPHGGDAVSRASVQQRARTSFDRGWVTFEHGGPPQCPPHEIGQHARPFEDKVPSQTGAALIRAVGESIMISSLLHARVARRGVILTHQAGRHGVRATAGPSEGGYNFPLLLLLLL